MITKVINNLHTNTEKVDYELAIEMAELIRDNFIASNKGEYSEEELVKLLANKTPENIYTFLCSGLCVLLYIEREMAGFGMVVRKNNLYEAKYLNVKSKFKGRGLGKKICDTRESYVKEMGIRELYIESLRFDNTLRFHKSRGFYDIPNIRTLYFTKYMKKDL